ncbi:NUDIX domain-containing protein [Candidatus Woesearchaeota archaeon]|nr:NUDIX domain-containing protein [Candidatus Woesearchaeota archaeon]
MKFEKSAGAIVFRKNNKIKFLLLYRHAHKHYREAWDFPKGLIEKGESIKETAKREIKEETGIEAINFVEGYKKKINYSYHRDNKLIKKEVIFFLAETDQINVTVSKEHDDYDWFTYKQAEKILTYSTSKELLEKAKDVLEK